MKKFLFLIFISLLYILPAYGVQSANMPLAASIGEELVSEFRPDSVYVKVNSNSAWIELSGGRIDGIRIEKMKLEADLIGLSDKKTIQNSGERLAEMIKSSRGEMVLAEKDVNDYFNENEDPRGFSDLSFDFMPDGFRAKGKFRTRMIIDIELPISAKGILALREDGVYLDKTVISVKGISQPEALTEMIVSRINPLLEFKEMPFPVIFEKIEMNESAAVLTGNPAEFKNGDIWLWNKADY